MGGKRLGYNLQGARHCGRQGEKGNDDNNKTRISNKKKHTEEEQEIRVGGR